MMEVPLAIAGFALMLLAAFVPWDNWLHELGERLHDARLRRER